MDIPEENILIIKCCRNYWLFHQKESWKKKDPESCFNVTMSISGRSENCELVGLYIMSNVSEVDMNFSVETTDLQYFGIKTEKKQTEWEKI